MVIMHHLKIPAFGCWARRAFTASASLKPLQLFNQQLRFKTTQIDCSHLKLKCGDHFKQKPCVKQQLDIKPKQPAPEPLPVQQRSIKIRRSVECCGDPCPDALPRFDLMYYKGHNYVEREYQQTWDEFPEPMKKPKICCLDKIIPAKTNKRLYQDRPNTACQQACMATKAICPYVTSKGCRPAKYPPKCKRIRIKSLCEKHKAPSPAFSENTPNLAAFKPVECRCLLTPSICEVWAYYHYLENIERLKKARLC